MLQVLKAATLVGILLLDLIRMRNDFGEIKRRETEHPSKRWLGRKLLILLPLAGPTYYALELATCLAKI